MALFINIRNGSTLSEELSHCNGIGQPCLLQQKENAMDPVSQGILAGGIQEKKLFCHGSQPLEHSASQGEIHTHPFGMNGSAKWPEAPVGACFSEGD